MRKWKIDWYNTRCWRAVCRFTTQATTKGDEEEKVKEEKKLKILTWNKLLNDSTVPKFVASVSK